MHFEGIKSNDLEKSLLLKGWVRGPDGSLTAPSRAAVAPVGGLGAGVRVEQAGPLVGSTQAVTGGAGGIGGSGAPGKASRRAKSPRRPADADSRKTRDPVVTVCFVCIRPKRLDDDNLSGGCKSLRDAVAEWLGVDDGDPRVAWEYRQQVGKPAGVIVLIS